LDVRQIATTILQVGEVAWCLPRVAASNDQPDVFTIGGQAAHGVDDDFQALVGAESAERQQRRPGARRHHGDRRRSAQRSQWHHTRVDAVTRAHQVGVFGQQHAHLVGDAKHRRGQMTAQHVDPAGAWPRQAHVGHPEHVVDRHHRWKSRQPADRRRGDAGQLAASRIATGRHVRVEPHCIDAE
jgi:hypothetical protein